MICKRQLKLACSGIIRSCWFGEVCLQRIAKYVDWICLKTLMWPSQASWNFLRKRLYIRTREIGELRLSGGRRHWWPLNRQIVGEFNCFPFSSIISGPSNPCFGLASNVLSFIILEWWLTWDLELPFTINQLPWIDCDVQFTQLFQFLIFWDTDIRPG